MGGGGDGAKILCYEAVYVLSTLQVVVYYGITIT